MEKWKPIDSGYFIKFYKEKLKNKEFLESDISKIIENSQDVLSKSINPKLPNNNGRLSSTNIVLGYIQSGKTTSMEAVSCMARDNGYKLIIILSGHVTNLADQTKKRVYKSLDMYGWDRLEIERGKKKILTHGNLNSVRNIIDISDAMEAYWLTAKRGKVGEIYNISGKKVISVRNYLKELKKLSKVKIKSKIDNRLLRPVDVTLQIADTTKFIRDTNWSPKISFKESMLKLLKECRKS